MPIPTILKGDTSAAIGFTAPEALAELMVVYQGVTRRFTGVAANAALSVQFTAAETARFRLGTFPLVFAAKYADGHVKTYPLTAKIKVTDSPALVYGSSVVVDPGGGKPLDGVDELPARHTQDDVADKINEVIRKLGGGAATALMLCLSAFGAEIQTAPLGSIYNDAPVVTNVTFAGLATSADLSAATAAAIAHTDTATNDLAQSQQSQMSLLSQSIAAASHAATNYTDYAVSELARTNDIPLVVAPSTNAATGSAADAKAVGEDISLLRDKSDLRVYGAAYSFTPWVISRNGVDVTAQVWQPIFYEDYVDSDVTGFWDVSLSVLSGEVMEIGLIPGVRHAVSLDWTSYAIDDNGYYVGDAIMYKATRKALGYAATTDTLATVSQAFPRRGGAITGWDGYNSGGPCAIELPEAPLNSSVPAYVSSRSAGIGAFLDEPFGIIFGVQIDTLGANSAHLYLQQANYGMYTLVANMPDVERAAAKMLPRVAADSGDYTHFSYRETSAGGTYSNATIRLGSDRPNASDMVYFGRSTGVYFRNRDNIVITDGTNECGVATDKDVEALAAVVSGLDMRPVELPREAIERGLTFVNSYGEDQNCAIEIGSTARAKYDVSNAASQPSNTVLRSVSIAIGDNADALVEDNKYSQAIAIGWHAQAKKSNAIAIGNGAQHPDESAAAGTGDATYAGGGEAIAIGYSAWSTNSGTVAIGGRAKAYGDHSIALGGGEGSGASAVAVVAAAKGSVQIGAGTNNSPNSLKFRDWEIVGGDGQIPSNRLVAVYAAMTGGAIDGVRRAIRPGNMTVVFDGMDADESGQLLEPRLDGLSVMEFAPDTNGVYRAGTEVAVDPPLGSRNYDIVINEIPQCYGTTNGVPYAVPPDSNCVLSFGELSEPHDVTLWCDPSCGEVAGLAVVLTNAPCIVKVREPATNRLYCVVKPWGIMDL